MPTTTITPRTPQTLGEHERAAGITDRVAFWNRILESRPEGETGAQYLDRGVAELRRIAARKHRVSRQVRA